eukprot:COSAG04_NODE_861_length_9806_cov_5.052127_13_plen_52_part_00
MAAAGLQLALPALAVRGPGEHNVGVSDACFPVNNPRNLIPFSPRGGRIGGV